MRKKVEMGKAGFTDTFSYIIAIASTLASFYIFYRDNGLFWGSFAAALMTGILVFVTYLMLRWLLLANKG